MPTTLLHLLLNVTDDVQLVEALHYHYAARVFGVGSGRPRFVVPLNRRQKLCKALRVRLVCLMSIVYAVMDEDAVSKVIAVFGYAKVVDVLGCFVGLN